MPFYSTEHYVTTFVWVMTMECKYGPEATEPNSGAIDFKLLTINVLYGAENKLPHVCDLQICAQISNLVYKPVPLCCKYCTISKRKCLDIDKNAISCSKPEWSVWYICLC